MRIPWKISWSSRFITLCDFVCGYLIGVFGFSISYMVTSFMPPSYHDFPFIAVSPNEIIHRCSPNDSSHAISSQQGIHAIHPYLCSYQIFSRRWKVVYVSEKIRKAMYIMRDFVKKVML
ncbi:hypothetical protein L6452_40844 [Arctium lappa]|uniref:Uncharacterized protein n=1 Tax=Arctium lappa TaxID=4217 RepID=A0ACB8XMC6_ARCLA|nr:hypothetical protein L6452_40844 [Arctium lappa]